MFAGILAPLILRPQTESQLTVFDIHPNRLARDLLLYSPKVMVAAPTSPTDVLSDSSNDDDEASTRAIFPSRSSPTPSSLSAYTVKTTKTGTSLGGLHEDSSSEADVPDDKVRKNVVFTLEDDKNN